VVGGKERLEVTYNKVVSKQAKYTTVTKNGGSRVVFTNISHVPPPISRKKSKGI